MNHAQTHRRAEEQARAFRRHLTVERGMTYPFYHLSIAEGALTLVRYAGVEEGEIIFRTGPAPRPPVTHLYVDEQGHHFMLRSR